MCKRILAVLLGLALISTAVGTCAEDYYAYGRDMSSLSSDKELLETISGIILAPYTSAKKTAGGGKYGWDMSSDDVLSDMLAEQDIYDGELINEAVRRYDAKGYMTDDELDGLISASMDSVYKLIRLLRYAVYYPEEVYAALMEAYAYKESEYEEKLKEIAYFVNALMYDGKKADEELKQLIVWLIGSLRLAAPFTDSAREALNTLPSSEPDTALPLDLNEADIKHRDFLLNDGKTHKLTLTEVHYKGEELEEGKDYTIDGADKKEQRNAGSYKFTLHGINRFEGSEFSDSWSIVPHVGITADNTEIVFYGHNEYDGEEKTPLVKAIRVGDLLLEEDTDFSVNAAPQTEIGEYDMVIQGIGNCQGSFEAKWTIEPAGVKLPSERVKVTAAIGHDLREVRCDVDALDRNNKLVPGFVSFPESHIVTPYDDGNEFDGVFTANSYYGKQNYKQMPVKAILKVSLGDIGDARVTVGEAVYNGSPQSVPILSVTVLGEELTEGVDYKLDSDDEAIFPGTYRFTLNGKGDYANSRYEGTWTIDKARIDNVVLEKNEFTYDGKPHSVNITGVYANGAELGKKDYLILREENMSGKKPGEYTFAVAVDESRCSWCTGEKEVKWSIVEP